MADFVIVVILVVMTVAAIRYIFKEKKKGVSCIGCSMAGCCRKNTKGQQGYCQHKD